MRWADVELAVATSPVAVDELALDYQVDDPGALAGAASDRHGRTFEYVSRRRPEGWLTLAVCDAAA